MTYLEKVLYSDLILCRFAPGTWDKKFVKSLDTSKDLTELQNFWLHVLHHRYRGQIPTHDCKNMMCPQLCSHFDRRTKCMLLIDPKTNFPQQCRHTRLTPCEHHTKRMKE